MAMIVNKIAQLEKAAIEIKEKFENHQVQTERRFQKLEKAIHDLINKTDELSMSFNAAFTVADEVDEDGNPIPPQPVVPVDPLDVNAKDFNSFLQYDADGTVLVTADKREEMEARGLQIVGTVSKDQTLLLRMRQG